MSEFEKWWSSYSEVNEMSEWRESKMCGVAKASFAAGQAASAARIAELEADCKVMAEYIANGDHCLSINCACPACTIAGKYKEEIATWYAEEGWLLDEDDVAYAIRQRGGE